MNKKVSILVLENNPEYTYRCISSINNQTYKEIEVWVLGAQEEEYDSNYEIRWVAADCTNYIDVLKDSINKATGEFVLLIKSTFVLSTTCIEALLKDNCSFSSATILYDEQSGLERHDEDRFLIYGKLFEKKKISENHVQLTGLFAEEQLEFLLQMSLHNEKYARNKDAFIYALAEACKYDINCDFIIKMYKKYGILLTQYYGSGLLENCNLEYESDLKKLQFVVNIYPCIRQSIKENIRIAESYIRPVIEKIRRLENKEQEYYELKRYFELINGEAYKEIVYDALECTPRMVSLLTDLDYESYKYCVNKADKYMVKNIEEKAGVLDLSTQINRMEKYFNTGMQQVSEALLNQSTEKKDIKNIEDIYGLELIDFTLNCYENGKLGFKTILRSIKSWFRHKLS